MKKIIYLNIIIFSFFSCTKKQKDLKIELLTNEIVCVDNLKSFDYIETRYQPNKEYDSLSKNILHYRIINNSDKKYFIMFNENSIGTLERDLYNEAIGKKDLSPLNSLDFSLYKNNSVLDGCSTKIENACGTMVDFEIKRGEFLINKYLEENKLERMYALKRVDLPNELLQSFVLHPGEIKYFTSIVNLPYRNDKKWFSNVGKLKPNEGSISLKNDSIFTKSKITDDQKKEIKENGYVLFNDKIYSNRVPVKLIYLRAKKK
ncbi:hypothetical protein N4T20_20695 [Flavobacterium sp. TR2]|uniref:hypothetical protein n=1 Tax=Flavobacterium sp. TR2 TaxID=2977321 RepID=UPI0021B0B494|nr:hypothetical protein [Flavobacterium sp. TR2]UWY28128.1 hypothetical protein N4T20_20695 [Flavobacterium sp. TR2]